VFPATATSCLTFGQTFGVTRTSGNSNTAQMKDIVGPGDLSLSNCGTVIIRKQTDPDGDTTTNFQFTNNLSTLPATTTSPFTLKDDGVKTISNVVSASSRTVTETDPAPGYALTAIDCSASSNTGNITSTDVPSRTATFTVAAGETVDCTFTNTKQVGALKIVKQSTKSGNPLVSNDGAVFSYDGTLVTDNGTGDEDSTVGEVCVSGLATGDYTINESIPPLGYGGAPLGEADQTATVVAGTDCSANEPTGTAVVTFNNAPLSDIQVRFRDGGSGETSLVSAISCDNATGTDDTTDTSGWDDTLTVEGIEAPTTITCTIDIDP
jgi:hypothetical protein